MTRRAWFGLGGRSIVAGIAAALGMSLFYIAVVAGASQSWTHLGDQVADDWALLVFVLAGFAVQVALFTELRYRYRLQATVALTSGAGMGASTAGMVACCAHHIADLLPFLGATGAAAFLYDYRIAFVLVGIGVNAVGVTIAVRRLRRTPMPEPAAAGRQAVHRPSSCDLASPGAER
jgi:hypothetical protein